MAKHARPRTIALPWRRVCAALPSIALIGGGLAVTAPVGDLSALLGRDPQAVAVPEIMLNALRVPADPAGPAGRRSPGLVLPEGTRPGSSTLVTLDRLGIPARALSAYRQAAVRVAAADPACHIDWALLAAVGRVESDHGRFDGNDLDSSGIARPGIIGIALDGSNGTARITDSDGGALDRDTDYDRGVGPMQFIPTTWRMVGVDADGDGAKNPQDMADAATSSAIHLCSGPGDLSNPSDLRSAIMGYNASESYARTVTAIADAYRRGVRVLPASDLSAAGGESSSSGTSSSPTPVPEPTPRKPAPGSTPTEPPVITPSDPPTNAPPPPPPAPLPPVPTPRPTSTSTTAPARPLTEVVCTSSPLGVITCTTVPLG